MKQSFARFFHAQREARVSFDGENFSLSMQFSYMIYDFSTEAYYLNEWMHQHQESMMYEMNFSNAIKKNFQPNFYSGEKSFSLLCGFLCYSESFTFRPRFLVCGFAVKFLFPFLIPFNSISAILLIVTWNSAAKSAATKLFLKNETKINRKQFFQLFRCRRRLRKQKLFILLFTAFNCKNKHCYLEWNPKTHFVNESCSESEGYFNVKVFGLIHQRVVELSRVKWFEVLETDKSCDDQLLFPRKFD